jgi:GcrA cell cycle regulator
MPARTAVPRRVTGPTLPPLSAAEPVVAPPPPLPRPVAPVIRAEVPKPQIVRPVPAPRSLRTQTCCWPLGDPGTPSFRFCDGDAALGKPYCAEHAAVAYVRVRDKREEAVA